MVLKLIDSGQRRSRGQLILTTGVSIVIVSLLFVLLRTNGDASSVPSYAEQPPPDSETSATAAMSDLSSYSLSHFSIPGEPITDSVISDGLRNLSTALEVVLDRNPEVGERHAATPGELRLSAETLLETSAPLAGVHAAREAFQTASATMTALQRRNFPELAKAAEQVRTSAGALRGDRSFDAQREELNSFFEHASDVLRAMIEIRP